VYASFEEAAAAGVGAQVAIDFSHASLQGPLIEYCLNCKLPLVSATTGLSEAEEEMLASASKSIPVFRAKNFSYGIALLRRLVSIAAASLGDGYDIEIVETHHRRKKDAPSGTALAIAGDIASVLPNSKFLYGRYGTEAKREAGEVAIHAVRGGIVTGRHEVAFYGDGEEIVISHNAESREVFASGALKAASFLLSKGPGLYAMEDIAGEAEIKA